MYYYNPDKRTGRVAASIATLLYFLTLAVLFVLVRFTLPEEQEYGNGMLIDFGTVAEAGGLSDPSVSEVDESASQPSSAPQPVDPQLTSDDEEAPEIAQQQKQQKPQPTQTQQPTKRPVEQTDQAPPRQVNKRALFSGSTQRSTSTSEGTSEGMGRASRVVRQKAATRVWVKVSMEISTWLVAGLLALCPNRIILQIRRVRLW